MYMDALESEVEALSSEVTRLRQMLHRVTQVMEAPSPLHGRYADPMAATLGVTTHLSTPLTSAPHFPSLGQQTAPPRGSLEALERMLSMYQSVLPIDMMEMLVAQQQHHQGGSGRWKKRAYGARLQQGRHESTRNTRTTDRRGRRQGERDQDGDSESDSGALLPSEDSTETASDVTENASSTLSSNTEQRKNSTQRQVSAVAVVKGNNKREAVSTVSEAIKPKQADSAQVNSAKPAVRGAAFESSPSTATAATTETAKPNNILSKLRKHAQKQDETDSDSEGSNRAPPASQLQKQKQFQPTQNSSSGAATTTAKTAAVTGGKAASVVTIAENRSPPAPAGKAVGSLEQLAVAVGTTTTPTATAKSASGAAKAVPTTGNSPNAKASFLSTPPSTIDRHYGDASRISPLGSPLRKSMTIAAAVDEKSPLNSKRAVQQPHLPSFANNDRSSPVESNIPMISTISSGVAGGGAVILGGRSSIPAATTPVKSQSNDRASTGSLPSAPVASSTGVPGTRTPQKHKGILERLREQEETTSSSDSDDNYGANKNTLKGMPTERHGSAVSQDSVATSREMGRLGSASAAYIEAYRSPSISLTGRDVYSLGIYTPQFSPQQSPNAEALGAPPGRSEGSTSGAAAGASAAATSTSAVGGGAGYENSMGNSARPSVASWNAYEYDIGLGTSVSQTNHQSPVPEPDGGSFSQNYPPAKVLRSSSRSSNDDARSAANYHF